MTRPTVRRVPSGSYSAGCDFAASTNLFSARASRRLTVASDTRQAAATSVSCISETKRSENASRSSAGNVARIA